MFSKKANAMCNNILFKSGIILLMHETMTRLYMAAKELKGVTGQSAVAALMNQSPQTLNNWETRGVSQRGLIAAEQSIGCSAVWIKTGIGAMGAGAAASVFSGSKETQAVSGQYRRDAPAREKGDEMVGGTSSTTMAARLKRQRNKLGLTQADLAKKAGLSPALVVDMERGSDSRLLGKLAEALGVNEDWIRNGDSGDMLNAWAPSDATISDRLLSALAGRLDAAEALADTIGIDTDTLENWINGNENASMTLAQATKIQAALGVNAVWLLTGKGEPGSILDHYDGFEPPAINHVFEPMSVTDWKPVPVVGMAQLGDGVHFVDMEYPVGHGDGYVDFPSPDPDAYAVRCVGDSMKPRIQHGEFAVIEPNQPIDNGDDVLIKSVDGRVMVKRFLYRRGGRTHVVSVNDAHPPIAFDDDQIEKMHFVRAICRPKSWRNAS